MTSNIEIDHEIHAALQIIKDWIFEKFGVDWKSFSYDLADNQMTVTLIREEIEE